MKYLEMKVTGVVVDPGSYIPMVILKSMDEKNTLPIWIGIAEAAAILTEMEELELERPMTHDLTKNIISLLGASVSKVSVVDMMDNTFYARISLVLPSGETKDVDSRPSDAIALAIRCKAPIMVNEDVIFKARVVDLSAEHIKGKSKEELSAILESLSADDFGKYKM